MTIEELKHEIINYLLNNIGGQYVNFHEKPTDLDKSIATMKDIVLGDIMDFLKSQNYIDDIVDVLTQVVADCLQLNINVYQCNESYIQKVQICGGPGCKDINVKFTHNPQNAHENHYDSIVRSPKPPSMECCLYSDVVKKPIKHEQPMNIKRGTEMNPIVIDDFLPLETIKQEIIPKEESDIKEEIEELPLDLSMPKKPQSGHTEENNDSGKTNNEAAENFENTKVKEEPSAVAVSDIISDVTYISDDCEDQITILDDHPARLNKILL